MNIYCTYITVYRGNKLPPFYIGSTLIHKIHKGYRGSVRSKSYQEIWETELKNNPHLFNTRILTHHATHEEALTREATFQTKLSVINNPLYINLSIAKRGFGNLSKASRLLISNKAKLRDYSYMKGKNHHYYGGRNDLDQNGGKNPIARKCIVYGKMFDSIQDASTYFNIPYKKCYKLIRNNLDNCRYI